MQGKNGDNLLFWKCNSLWGARRALEGVAGEPWSCRRLKLAWRSWPARFGMNLRLGQPATAVL